MPELRAVVWVLVVVILITSILATLLRSKTEKVRRLSGRSITIWAPLAIPSALLVGVMQVVGALAVIIGIPLFILAFVFGVLLFLYKVVVCPLIGCHPLVMPCWPK